jgi:dTDP-3-amino-3,4,6-trideoxy-alpha-D-glucose transaminase
MNSRLDEVQAALLRRVMLPRLEEWTARRREVARRYAAEITSAHIRVPVVGESSVRHLFPVFVPAAAKAGFFRYLRACGIVAGEHYPIPIHHQEAMESVPFEVFRGCPVAEELCRSEVSLPLHPFLTEDEVATVIRVCNEWSPD